MKFTHIHTHSHYSLLDGLAKIDDLIDRCVELKMESLALTDHGSMYGIVEFYQKAQKKGIKPILGVEVYVAPNGMHNKTPKIDEKRNHLLLLAKNNFGYRNLIKLTSKAHLEGFYHKPRIDKDLLKNHAEGLIGTSACLAGEISRKILAKEYNQAEEAALQYKQIFAPGCFFLELEAHPTLPGQNEINEHLIKMGKKLGIPVVAANDIHYVRKDDNTAQDILLCIQTNKQVSDTNRLSMLGEDYSMKSPEEMAEFFKDTPEAIENTQKIAEMCAVELNFKENFLPEVDVRLYKEKLQCELSTADDVVKELCLKNIDKKYPSEKNRKEITDRLDFELSTIKKMGFASYFLIVEDYTNWAKQSGIIVGPGRGSAAGSIVAYLLNITDLDPLEYNLLFERFLNPDRISMPDIDLDFADNRRDEVIEYTRKKYGDDRVAQIITFGTMAARGSVRDSGRALGYPYQFCDKISKMIPSGMKLKEAIEGTQDLKNLYNTDQAAKKLLDSAKKLEGVARHSSTHACGVVITPDNIDNHVPRQFASQDDRTIVTQYSMKHIESIGLLKMDFLGLANLTIIEKALEIIRQEKNPEIALEKIPFNDVKTFKLFHRGETTGVFQFESSGMKKYLKMLKPGCFEDLISMVALYRPGPLNSGMVDEFIARKNGQKKIAYRHPSMENALKSTYGVIVYQEQVMQLSKDMAGFTGGESDTLRKAMGKKIAEMMEKMGSKFVEGCEKNNIPKKIAQETFDDMAKFAEYGFNRSHAACYALIGYQTAYLKANYPAEFMAALLASDRDNLDRITIEISECKQMGIEVLPPSINESFGNFRIVENDGKEAIRFGLSAIKNVGENVVGEIVKERLANGEYKSLSDLLERVHTKDLNKKSLESLAKSGALDCLEERNKILSNIEKILGFLKEIHKIKEVGQRNLFDSFANISSVKAQIKFDPAEPAPKKERLLWEKELLGFYLSEHPLGEYKNFLEKKTVSFKKFPEIANGSMITVGGIIQKVQKIITKNGQPMYFIILEDFYGKFELVVFPKIAQETETVWAQDAVVIARGKINDKDGEKKILCEKARLITPEDLNLFRQREKQPPSQSAPENSSQKNSDNYGANYGASSTATPELNTPKINKENLNTAKNLSELSTENATDSIKDPQENASLITIKIKNSNCIHSLKKIENLLKTQEKGQSQIIIQIPSGDSFNNLATPYKVKHSLAFINTLKETIGSDIIEMS
ncbi:MAG: DNA polymerase III subunit alpha [bacterium]